MGGLCRFVYVNHMKNTRIVFLILPHTHLLDLAGPDQVFHEAIGFGAEITVAYCSIEKSVATSSQLNIAQLVHFSKTTIRKGDYVFIPGTDVRFLTGKIIPDEKELKQWLTEGYKKGAFICSICTGAFLLARIGLLNGRKCTTHWKRTQELKKRYPAINLVEDILFTEDERIYTSAGVTAGIDMALHIIAKLKDDNFSFKVARELVVYTRRKGSELQQSVFMNYRNHIHTGVHKVQDYLQEHVQKKITLDGLAAIACMSARNLTRVFKKETGITINDYSTLIRMEYLQKLLQNPDISRKEMANLCGLKSERQVIRLLKNYTANRGHLIN
jgi:transcriptional regulator GlxA family with amidase domain